MYSLKRKLAVAVHHFEVVQPDSYIPYPDSAMLLYCTGISIDDNFYKKFPYNARLKIDGLIVGQLSRVFRKVKK